MREVESELLPQKQSAGRSSRSSNNNRNDPEIQTMSSPTHHKIESSHTLNIPTEVASPGGDDDKYRSSSATSPSNHTQKKGLLACCEFWVLWVLSWVLTWVLALPFFSGYAVVCITVIPLLWVSILVTLLFLFLSCGQYYVNAWMFKFVLSHLMCFALAVLLIVTAGIFFPIVEYVPSLKHVMLAGLPLTNWLIITCLMCTLYIVYILFSNIAIRVLKHHMSADPLRGENNAEFVEAATEVISGLLFWWAASEVRNRVPAFEHHHLLGLPTYKWIEVSTFIFIGYNIIRFCTIGAPSWLWKAYRKCGPKPSDNMILLFSLIEKVFCKKYLAFCASRLRRSISFMLSSLLLLLTWVLYFGSHLNGTEALAKSFLDYGTWTFLSFFICSLLWLIKSGVLLTLEVNSVYNRLQHKIFEAGKQLCFLVILSLGKNAVAIEPWMKRLREHLQMHQAQGHQDCTPTLYDIYIVAQIFVQNKIVLSRKTFVSAILDELKSNYLNRDDRNMSFEEYLKQLIRGEINPKDVAQDTSGSSRTETSDDWEYFQEFLRHVSENSTANEDMDSSGDLYFEKVRTWAERAHNSCLFLANTLGSAEEVVDCLNKIISVFLVGATFIMWLLLTGLATTKVLVLIASPLLAATFIFGETCKTLFQGIIFVYVTHPFDVGDICIIDDKMMDVQAIGVWTTTFTKIGTKGEVIYPNSELMKKVLINHSTEFDWEDYVEFNLGSLGLEKVGIFKQHIEKHLKQDNFEPSAHTISMLETGDQNTKITVRFKHKVRSEDWTYSECFRHKERLRFEFALHVKNLIKNLDNKEDSETSGVPHKETATGLGKGERQKEEECRSNAALA